MSKHVWTVAGAWLVTGQRSHWRLRDSRNLGVAVVTSADLEIPEIQWLDSLRRNVLQVQPQPYPTSATSLSFRPNSASAKLSPLGITIHSVGHFQQNTGAVRSIRSLTQSAPEAGSHTAFGMA